MMQKLSNIHPLLPKMILFFCVSFSTVFVELFFFWLVNSVFQWHYTIAVTLSLAIAMIANWYASRVFVFKTSNKKLHHEFMLIVFANFITLLIQLATTSIVVELFNGPAFLGKIISLGIAFFWNFGFRHYYIFNEK